jgi:hypothetical protein
MVFVLDNNYLAITAIVTVSVVSRAFIEVIELTHLMLPYHTSCHSKCTLVESLPLGIVSKS